MLRSKSRSGYVEFGQKKQSTTSFIIKSISGSKICRGERLVSQVDKEALVSVDRKSISLSENRIVKAAMMQKQMSDLEEELKVLKARLNETEIERLRVVDELNAGLSASKAEHVFNEVKSLKDSILNFKKEIELRDKEISSLSGRLESAKAFEVKLAERDVELDGLKKKIRELENEVEKTKQSESNMLESLMLQTQQITQTKMDLEESKLEVSTLQEQLEDLQRGNRNGPGVPRGNVDTSWETKALKDEIRTLKGEVKLAMEAEEKSKKAMDDLASALSEVALETSQANEKLRLAEEKITELNEEIKELNEELESQTEEYEQLRVESEESLLAWTAKETGFISCIKKADEENSSLKHENNKLKEAVMSAENTSRIVREEGFKLRDILKQALNESNVAKEASNIARAENSELKDLLAEKEETLHFVTKENERLRINEVAARENVKEFKRLLAAKAEADKQCDDKDQTDVFNSPVSSLYEEHIDGRTTPQQAFSFDLDELRGFAKEEYQDVYNHEDDMAEIVVDDDPEKAEALKGSIFDTMDSPTSEPQTPKWKGKSATVYSDASGSGQSEEVDYKEHSSGNHTEDDDKQYYMYGLYNHSRKKLFRKIGELIIGKNNSSKKEGSPEHGKEAGKEHGKEPGKEQSKEPGKEQGKEPGKEQSKEQGKEQSKDEEN